MQEIRLSKREKILAELMKQGYKACEIRRIMNIEVSTVVTYRKSLYTKFGVAGKRELLKTLKNYQL